MVKRLGKKVYSYLHRLVRKFIDDRCQILAASITFYSTLSIFPAILILIAFSGYVIKSFSIQANILAFVEDRIPLIYEFVNNNLSSIIANRHSLGIIGLVIVFFAATYVFDSIQYAMNRIFRTDTHRKYWKQKLYGFLIVVLVFVIIVTTFTLSTGLFYLSNNLFEIFDVDHSSSVIILKVISIAVGILFNFLIFTLIYYFGTNKRIYFRQIYRGALTIAFGWEAVKYLFVFYIDKFANYQLVYGSVGSVIAFLLWIYISSMIMLLGAEINSLRFKA